MRTLVVLLLALCLLGAVSAAKADGLPAFPGLRLHLDASTITADNETLVASWADVSGNGYVATQDDPKRQPTFKDRGVNGVPSVYFRGYTVGYGNGDGLFDEWSDAMKVDPADSGSDPLLVQEVFVVTNAEAPWSHHDGAWDHGCCTALLAGQRDQMRIGNHWSDARTFEVDTYNNPFSQGGEFLINGVENLIGDGDILTPFVEGPPMILDIVAGEPKDWGVLAVAAPGDPPDMDNGQRVWHGNIAEIIMYDNVLTDVQRLQVGFYLGEKYGIEFVPEPSTWLLLVTGLFGLGLGAWRRRKH